MATAMTPQRLCRPLYFSSEETNSLLTGHVKWFDVKKGFGFIIPNNGDQDVFVHQTSIHAEGFRSLAEGEEVEFEVDVDESNGRRSARNVTGPDGGYVQGAPRPERINSFEDFGYDNYSNKNNDNY